MARTKCIDFKRKFGGGWLELGTAEMGKKNNTRAKRHFEEARMIGNGENWQKEKLMRLIILQNIKNE